IVNTGVAGGLSKNLKVGDVVVAVDAVQWDFDVTILGFRKGEVPYTGKYAFVCDENLRRKALKAAREAAPNSNVIEARACAGDTFIQTPEQADAITSAFGAASIEMESGAIGQVCCLNHVPFAVIRVISDTTTEDVESSSYKDVEAMTAELCAAITQKMIMNF
ncbi:MAG: 5'-methylthioadenosine/S-adenosylhomocysteine nucleosidase, partial [Synergistaceae bacterium]|nr:5'-methylthioadenosine/S-adenosylhomocysteine nucleosidase [Synergistaceae bacterium]